MAAPPDEPSRPTDDGTRRAPRAPDRHTANPLGASRAAPRTPDMHTDPDPVASSLAPPFVPGYTVAKEIDRGGMGIVYEASDLAFNRVVAIKTLLPGRPFDADATRRFDTEAYITARLQHPNVPPVFAVGKLADGRPYMVMKLVRGRHMGKLLKERPTPATGLTRVLAAFEQVCQAVGYAHARGVLHRDLKPSNVMVGEFGEVQVMDWGLAKEGAAPGSAPRADDSQTDPWGTGVPSVVPPPGADGTRAGQALGTPAYMAPEQARGDWDRVGPWSDVFALGGILADILTGRPPFVADSALGTLMLAEAGNVTDAFARLDASGADPALVALTKRCLAPDPQHRPPSGQDLAAATAAYRAGVEARVRKAEAERAAAVAKEREAELRVEAEAEAKRAAEERADEADRRAKAERANAEAQRKRRQAQLLLAVAVALLLLGAGGFAWWRDAQAAERAAEKKAQDARAEAEQTAAEERNRTAVRAALKLTIDLRTQQKYREATTAIAQAEKLAAGLDDVLPGVRREKAAVAFARDLDAVRARKWAWVSNASGDGGRFDTASVPGAYAEAFATHGFALDRTDPAALARRIIDSPIRAEILRALDDWALTIDPKDRNEVDRVLDIAFRAGPSNDLATKLRDPAVRRDAARVNELIRRAEDVAESVAATLYVTALMERRGGNAHVLLAVAQARHPLDFDITFELALWHHAQDARRVPPERVEFHKRQAIAHYRTARALRPDHPAVLTNLGMLLGEVGEPAAAVAVLREAVKLHPADHVAHFNLASILQLIGQAPEAEASYRETIKLSPNYAAAHSNLAVVLVRQKKVAEAFPVIRRAIELDPNQPVIRVNYGGLLLDSGQTDAAILEFRKAIDLAPKLAGAHFGLGVALERKKDAAGALAAYREAVKLDPKKYAELAKKLPPEK